VRRCCVILSGDVAPECSEFLYPDPAIGPYRLRVWFDNLGRRPVVVGLELWGVDPQWRPWHDRQARATATGPQDDPARLEPTGLQLDPTAVTADVVHRLRLGALLDDYVGYNRALARAALKAGANRKAVDRYVQRFDVPKKPGRPRLRDELLQLVSDVYVAAERRGDRAPAKAVMQHLLALGHRDLKSATVRSWIHAARSRGFFDEEKDK
jgi:hypothetical protein